MKEELLKGLSEEQIAKIKACKNQEEMLAFAKQEGIELTDEQLEAVSGGTCTDTPSNCPKCGSNNIREVEGRKDYSKLTHRRFFCDTCFSFFCPSDY